MINQADFDEIQLIYEGNKNLVYRAIKRNNKESVIVKTPRNDLIPQSNLSTYRKEHQIYKILENSEHFLHVYDLVESDSSISLIMEDTSSISLSDYIKNSSFDLLQRIDIAIQIAQRIEELHSKGVVHKDINPHNILWNEAQKQIAIIDFSIATILPVEEQSFQGINQLEGNVAYISPEQTGRVNRPLDYRSDLYSFGISLYELFSGQLPFIESKSIELVHAHIAYIAVGAHKVNPNIPIEISQIISKLMRKMADERYQSTASIIADLRLCFEAYSNDEELEDFEVAKDDISYFLQMPHKLYGREEQYQKLNESFQRVTQGESELILISGFSGTGKTVLVQELFKPITEKRGNYISGKFDQYQRDIPYYAWQKTFESFLHLLLKEEQSEIDRWRDLILANLGEMVSVLIELVPDFELIIGKQNTLEVLPPDQALNRFHYAIGEFLNAISSEEHPLCIFIDDWQWADAASINLLKYLVNRFDNKYMLFITAWRDNEVDNTHLLTLALQDIQKAPTTTNKIYIDNLTLPDVREFINDTLHSPQNSDELIELVYEKTLGNAFFMKQFLKTLHRDSLLFIEPHKATWQWNISKIHEKNISNNVVELMTNTILTLGSDTQHALRIAACIGNKFEIYILALILKKSIEETRLDIQTALKQGILQPVKKSKYDNNTQKYEEYQFVHDRIQQAAYSLVESKKQLQTHYQIANIYLEQLDPNKHIFELINHINLSSKLFIKEQEQELLIKYNMLAGTKAKEGNAYRPAYNYFLVAIKHITEENWKKQKQQLSENFLSAAETAFLIGEYNQMELWLEKYLKYNRENIAQVDAYEIRLKAYITQNRLSEAVDTALFALKLLDVKFPTKPNKFHVLWNLLLTQNKLKENSFNELLNLPELTDTKKLKIMNILGLSIPPAYWTSPDLLALIVFYMVRSAVDEGYYPHTGYAFSWWGIIQGGLLGNLKEGFEFGAFGEAIARKNHLNLEQPVFFKGWITHHMREPLFETIEILNEAYQLSMEKGNFEYASYALNNNMQARFHAAEVLPELLEKMRSAHKDLEIFNLGSSLYWHDIWWQTAINFHEHGTSDIYKLNGIAYNESKTVPIHEKANDISTLFLVYTAKLILSTFFHHHDQAEKFSKLARSYSAGGAGMFANVLFYFYESLSLIKQLEKSSAYDAIKLKYRLKSNIKALSKFSKSSPQNHQHRLYLVKAELCRVENKPIEAEKYYELAIEQSFKQKFLQDTALCYEYAALFYAQKEQIRFMELMYKHALHLYQEWGADAKVQQLLSENIFLKNKSNYPAESLYNNETKATSTYTTAIELDIQSLFKSYQAISSSITIEELINNLLINVMENAGAQRALFLLSRQGILYVEGEAYISESNNQETSTTTSIKVNEYKDLLPSSIVNYVKNSRKEVVLNDARKSSEFSQDPYILKNKPISILCVPIVKQSDLIGIVYLENNLSTDVFNLKRLEFLQLLMAQVAISIENAAIYERLEDKVAERTKELDNANNELIEAQKKLEHQAKTDALTQLANRHYFNEFANLHFNHCVREKQLLSVLMCDVDNFKAYNDIYGHLQGDECLKTVADQFQKVFHRESDLTARYGGEEFVVVLPNTDQNDARELAQTLKTSIENQKMEHTGNEAYNIVTVSIGLFTMQPSNKDTMNTMLDKADEALYQAKTSGRNRVIVN